MSCYSCNARSAELSTCGVCKKATYCSHSCQTAHWTASDGHKLTCAAESADGELITHCDSILGRVATKNPHFFGPVRQVGARKLAVPSMDSSRAFLAAVQAAEAPLDDSKRAAADPPKSGRKRRGSSKRVMVKRVAAGPAVRKEGDPLSMDDLPPEMLEAIFDEVDAGTAVRLAQVSRIFAAMFRARTRSGRILDKIVNGKNILEDTAANVKMAQLIRRAIKVVLANVHGNARRERLNDVLDVIQPASFFALFLSLGRPSDFDYTVYSSFLEELHSFWRDNDDNRVEIDNEEWEILKVMCVHHKAAQVDNIQELFVHMARVDASGDFYIDFVQMITWVPSNFHLGYNVFHDLFEEDVYYDPKEPMTYLLDMIFQESTNLTAADWANLFYYSYRQEINQKLHEDENPDDPTDRDEFGGTPSDRPIVRFTSLEPGDRLPYIPDSVASALDGIFTDASVPRSEKQDDWFGIDIPGQNGENWAALWAFTVTQLKAHRRKTLPNPARPTPMDAAAV